MFLFLRSICSHLLNHSDSLSLCPETKRFNYTAK